MLHTPGAIPGRKSHALPHSASNSISMPRNISKSGSHSSRSSIVKRRKGSACTTQHRQTICHASSSSSSSADFNRSPSAVTDTLSPGEAFDVVIVGAGVGGLSCGALLASYGLKVGVNAMLNCLQQLDRCSKKPPEGITPPERFSICIAYSHCSTMI